MYDIFFIAESKNTAWCNFKDQYPTAKFAKSFDDAAQKCFTRFFWTVYDDLIVNSDFDFSYIPDGWSQDVVHVFRNGEHYDGLCLISKNNLPTKKEFEHRFFTKKKEVDILASTPKPYDIFYLNTYDEYINAIEKSSSDMFWVVYDDIMVEDNFDFSYRAPYWEKFTHVFLNKNYYDGISLHNKNKPVTEKEFQYRFYTQTKEVDTQASSPKTFDIVFISYNEPNAEENFQKLKNLFSNVKRVHGVEGIHNAHREAAKQVYTTMFWVVDGDAEIINNFNFDYQVPKWDQDAVHVWRSKNPVNGLIYGYGGVKLLPTNLTRNMDTSKPDMTTSISSKFKAVPEISNITQFNTDSFSAWRSGFRECAKLASGIIDRQNDQETQQRLDVWCNQGVNRPFGIDAIKGAIAGKKFGQENKNNPKELQKINDFAWLEEFYANRR